MRIVIPTGVARLLPPRSYAHRDTKRRNLSSIPHFCPIFPFVVTRPFSTLSRCAPHSLLNLVFAPPHFRPGDTVWGLSPIPCLFVSAPQASAMGESQTLVRPVYLSAFAKGKGWNRTKESKSSVGGHTALTSPPAPRPKNNTNPPSEISQ